MLLTLIYYVSNVYYYGTCTCKHECAGVAPFSPSLPPSLPPSSQPANALFLLREVHYVGPRRSLHEVGKLFKVAAAALAHDCRSWQIVYAYGDARLTHSQTNSWWTQRLLITLPRPHAIASAGKGSGRRCSGGASCSSRAAGTRCTCVHVSGLAPSNEAPRYLGACQRRLVITRILHFLSGPKTHESSSSERRQRSRSIRREARRRREQSAGPAFGGSDPAGIGKAALEHQHDDDDDGLAFNCCAVT